MPGSIAELANGNMFPSQLAKGQFTKKKKNQKNLEFDKTDFRASKERKEIALDL